MTCGTTQDVLHGLINYIDTEAKGRDLKKFTCKETFAAGVYQSLQTGDTVSHVGIFELLPLTLLSGLTLPPSFPSLCE
jgi:hypothetical protein